MIINQNNQNNILKGKMKRGFNQTPEELRKKLQNQYTNEIKEKTENTKDQIEKPNIAVDLKKARNILKRF